MNYQVLKSDQPRKLCVICHQPAESCKQDNHILDTIGFGWVVVDMDTKSPISWHLGKPEAYKACRSLRDTTG